MLKHIIIVLSFAMLLAPHSGLTQEACEGNFDFDQDVDGTDASLFKKDFGRSIRTNPCTAEAPCAGDFLCDGDVDGSDAAIFKQDFGRRQLLNPCPAFDAENHCSPPVFTTSTTTPVTTSLTAPSCGIEIARGRECPGTAIDDPAYNRPGRRGLSATCNDVIDFTICSDCVTFNPACLTWTIEPATGFLAITRIDACCWRLIIGDSCEQLQTIATYSITATDSCNGVSDSVEIDIGKVIVDVGDTTLQPHAASGLIDVNLINPEHAVSAMSLDIAACSPVTGAPANNPDNLTCTQCLVNPARTGDFTCSASEQVNGSCRVVLYATDPSAVITQGTGTVAQLVYSAGKELDGL